MTDRGRTWPARHARRVPEDTIRGSRQRRGPSIQGFGRPCCAGQPIDRSASGLGAGLDGAVSVGACATRDRKDLVMSSGTRARQRGAILLGIAGGMLVAAGGLTGAYYVVATRSEARAATVTQPPATDRLHPGATASAALTALLAQPVDVTANGTTEKLTWADLGVEVDPDELARVTAETAGQLSALGAKAALPVRIDRDKATKRLLALKAKTRSLADRRLPRSRGAEDPPRHARPGHRRLGLAAEDRGRGAPRCREGRARLGADRRRRHEAGARHRRHLARARALHDAVPGARPRAQLQPQARREQDRRRRAQAARGVVVQRPGRRAL